MVGLSKSRIASYEQCSRRLWLEVHCRELAEFDDGAQARFDAGNAVGAEASRQRPGGVMISAENGLAAAIAATHDAIAEDPTRPIFEATFEHEGVLIRADILQFRPGHGWHLTEVKSAGSFKPYHLADLATQAWVIEGNGLELADVQLAHIDTSFRLRTLGDYQGLFRHVSLLEQIRPIMTGRSELVAEIRGVLAGEDPKIAPGAHCSAPFTCPFTQHCNAGSPDGPEWPVTVLPGGGKKWLAQGIDDLAALPREKLTSTVHQRVFDATTTGVPYHDADAARRAIAGWSSPKTWLDFETIGFVMPRWVGTRPYEAVPFQFSALVEQADGSYEEAAFLDLTGRDPRRACAEALLALPCSGAVIAYNAGFERACIESLAAACLDLADDLLAMADRLVDLLPVTRATWYHRDQRGSWSIKAVLPTIAPELGYDDLEIGDGMAAQAAYLEATATQCSAERKDEIERALRIYCGRDTEAMIVLAWHLAETGAPPPEVRLSGEAAGITGDDELRIEPGNWYGMTMWPGYAGLPYHSPIKIFDVRYNSSDLEVDFLNAAYAAGVQDFSYTLAPLAHYPDYLIAAISEQPGRTVAIVGLEPKWLETYFPDQFRELRILASEADVTLDAAIPLLTRRWTGRNDERTSHRARLEPPSRSAQAWELEEEAQARGPLRRQDEADDFVHLAFDEERCRQLDIPHGRYPLRRAVLDGALEGRPQLDVGDLLLGLMQWLDVTDDLQPALNLGRRILDAHYPPDGAAHAACTLANADGVLFTFRVEPIDLRAPLVAWQREDHVFAFGQSSRIVAGRLAVGAPGLLSFDTAVSIKNHAMLTEMGTLYDSFKGAHHSAGRTAAYYNREAGRTEITPWDDGYDTRPRPSAVSSWLAPNQLAQLVALADGAASIDLKAKF